MILPFVRELLADAEKSTAFQRAATHLKSRAGRTGLSGLTPTAKALYLPLLHRAAGLPLLVVTADDRAADDLVRLLRSFAELTGAADPRAIFHLPAPDVLPFENLSPHPDIQEERAASLWKVARREAEILVAPLEAAAMRLRAAEFYAGLARVIRSGGSVDPDELAGHLDTVGYVTVDMVEMPGQYARRGGLFDVYPPEAERPLRLELYGDEVESIRRFDPASQRSSDQAGEAVLLPLTETPVREELLAAVHARLARGRVHGSDPAQAAAAGAGVFPGWEFFAAAGGAGKTLFDLLPGALVLLDEPSALRAAKDHWWEKIVAAHDRSGIGELFRPEDLYLSPDDWSALAATYPGADLEELSVEGESIAFHSQPVARFHGSVPALAEELRKHLEGGTRVLFAAATMGDVERLARICSEYHLPFRIGARAGRSADAESLAEGSSFAAGDLSSVVLAKAAVASGVALPETRLVLFGAHDLFDESEVVARVPARQRAKTSAFLSDFRDLAIGDYVVHVEHGIARFQGLKEIAQGETVGEFMLLEFAESAKIYVPLTRLDLVQKYRSTEGAAPVLSRLGSPQWARTKARVKQAMQDMAQELVGLYAQRKLARREPFSPDSPFQKEFEGSFGFLETEDQEASIRDVKRDMESPTPMDRLLCGDVGYGKTEVAMRAAFKAVHDGRQVAVLAPTTVLTFQHFETFKQRFAAFPVTIEMVSRFRTARQQKEILERVEAGKVDILIGTHRLLSRDVKFHDLGLLVVDEEQRFGVRHKERLKQIRKEVDVLTMSATPIPRTLHMSLVGLRDMSVIETPPRDRMAIQTVVAKFDDALVRIAIEHELERGGQVYFVHNRVESIYEIAAKVQALVPTARVLVGHGQMAESRLEATMLQFIRHEADVLVATTIIENGLDIPLCNTMIINRADRHGLSELYQLRGRVGRSNRRAYAYLLVPPDQELTPLARRRLAALKEFSDLGAGFKIAALDLELRGAGNLLGGEQSGHIDAVGFEMYTSMLDRTVREMKGETEAAARATQLNLALNLRIPHEYIAEENQRLRMYKRIAGSETEAGLDDVRAELLDRYGPLPAPVKNLLDAAALKLLCQRIGVAGADRKQNLMFLRFTADAAVDPQKLMHYVAAHKGAQFSPGGTLRFVVTSTAADEVIAQVKGLLFELYAVPATPGP
jgi:transcription-repair coupling factor (superfamily II helicase)